MTLLRPSLHLTRDLLLGAITALQVAWCRLRFPSHRTASSDAIELDGAVLVIRCEAKLGDNLLTIPFLRAVRNRYPGRPIHLLHHVAARAVYERCPYIDQRIEIDWAMSSPMTALKRVGLAAAVFNARLDKVRYAMALAPRWDEDLYAPFLGRISGAAQFVGFSRHALPAKACRNFGVDSLMTLAVVDRRVLHESIRPLLLLDPLVNATAPSSEPLEFWHSERDISPLTAPMWDAAHDDVTWIAIAPGAAVGRRQWPLQMFSALVTELELRPGVRFAFFGSTAESADCEALASAAPLTASLSLAGRLTLVQCAAALAQCRLFIGNDSGLMHLAAAAGTPILEISCHPMHAPPFHANAPARFGPIGHHCRVLRPQAPLTPECDEGCVSSVAHCITCVTVESVVEAAVSLLEATVSIGQAAPTAFDEVR